jgi:hypothetical protein
MALIKMGLDILDWIDLAQDKYMLRALLNVVMNLRVPKMLGSYSMAAQLVASRVALCSTE